MAAQIYPPQGCVCVFCKKQQTMMGTGSAAVEALRGSSSQQTPRGERSSAGSTTSSARERLASARSRASSQSLLTEESGEDDEMEGCSSGASSSSGSLIDGKPDYKFRLDDIGHRRKSAALSGRASALSAKSKAPQRQASFDAISEHFTVSRMGHSVADGGNDLQTLSLLHVPTQTSMNSVTY